jgi:hypothetical protein
MNMSMMQELPYLHKYSIRRVTDLLQAKNTDYIQSFDCEGRKELAHTMFRLQVILFSKITGAFSFRTFGGFLRVPATQIYCLTSAIISETRITNIYLNTMHDPPHNFDL